MSFGSKAGYLPFEQTIDLQTASTIRAVLEPEPTPTPTATPTPRGPAQGDVWTEPKTGMEFVWVEGGCFKMGSPDSEPGRYSDEGRVHEVCLDGFWMGKYEVTTAQTMKGIPLNGNDQPAVYVSWGGGQTICRVVGHRFPAAD